MGIDAGGFDTGVAHLVGEGHDVAAFLDEVGGVGGLENGIMLSPLLFVIDNEIIAFVKRFLEGFEINQNTLAIEVINRVSHTGKYLADPHTLTHLRKEVRFKPSLLDSRPYREWKEDSKTIIDRAQEKYAVLMRHHEVPPLETGLQKELDTILAAAKKELGAK